MNPNHPQVAARAEYRCEYCHAPESVANFPFEIEHVVPTAHEGPNTGDNYALSCRSCNAHKSARTVGRDPEGEMVTRLFHPRQDTWEQHFRVDVGTALLEGLTPLGRATIACLNMNSPAQRAARPQWVRLNLFP